MQENDERLISILRAADKHPNSNVSKLIRQFDAQPTSKNIVLLLMELAEHNEYVMDFDISLGYYLDHFSELLIRERIGFNDTGVFLHNSSKIYGRRVDCNYDYVNEHIKSFSSADKEDDESSGAANGTTPAAPGAIRGGRKRVVASAPDPYELEMALKKHRTISSEKRFQDADCVKKPKQLFQHIMDGDHVHPSQWLQSRMADFDNHDETDSKRNYKLFTYNLEHRYNTLVPDINFRLHFKMKDYLHGAEQRDGKPLGEGVGMWSQDHNHYTDKYLRLENRIFHEELAKTTRTNRNESETMEEFDEEVGAGEPLPRPCSAMEFSVDTGYGTTMMHSSIANDTQTTVANGTQEAATLNDTVDIDGNASLLNCTENMSMLINKNTSCSQEGFTQLNSTAHGNAEMAPKDDSAIVDSGIGTFLDATVGDETATSSSAIQEGSDLDNVVVNLRPYEDAEPVAFRALNAKQRSMLSPQVMVTDVFPRIPNKQNLTLIVDDEIMAMNNLPARESFVVPQAVKVPQAPLVINILKIDEKLLRRRSLFKLGAEFKVYQDQRRSRATRNPNEVQKRKFKPPLTSDTSAIEDTASHSPLKRLLVEAFKAKPPGSPFLSADDVLLSSSDFDGELEFLGFAEKSAQTSAVAVDEDEAADASGGDTPSKLQRLSKDSGIGEDGVQVTSAEEATHLNDSDAQMSLHESVAEARAGAETEMATAMALPEPDDRCDDEISPAMPTDADASVADMPFANNSSEVQELGDPPADCTAAIGGQVDHLKIRKWHEKLQPILANSQERNHFNIYDLGTDVMDTFSPSSPKINFRNVMEQRNKLDASRYLLAVLMLVNQGNVSIESPKSRPDRPSKWQEIKLALLKTERHKVDIADDIGRVGPTANTCANAKGNNHTRLAPKRTTAQTPKKKPPSLYRPSIDDDDDEGGDVFSPPTTPHDTATRCSVPKRSRVVPSSVSLPAFTPPQTQPGHTRSSTVSCDLSAIRPIRKIEQQAREDDMDSGVCSNMDSSA